MSKLLFFQQCTVTVYRRSFFSNNNLDIVRCTDISGVSTDGIAALYDAVLNDSVVTDINIVQDDGILDHAVVSYICFLEQNRVLYGSVDDGSAGDETVLNQGARIVFCRRKIIHLGVYVRIFLEEVVAVLPVLMKSMLVFVVGIYGSNVAPVGIQLVCVDTLQVLVTYQDIAYKVHTVFCGAAAR